MTARPSAPLHLRCREKRGNLHDAVSGCFAVGVCIKIHHLDILTSTFKQSLSKRLQASFKIIVAFVIFSISLFKGVSLLYVLIIHREDKKVNRFLATFSIYFHVFPMFSQQDSQHKNLYGI